jgi:YVTN family beta-propeller protein
MRGWGWAAAIAVLISSTPVGAQSPDHVGRQPDGSVVLPDNQRITPYGRQVEYTGHPSGVAIRPDGRTAVLHGADGSPALAVVDVAGGQIVQSIGGDAASYDGIAYSADGNTLFAAGHAGTVSIHHVNPDGTLGPATDVAIPGQPQTGLTAYAGGLAPSADGKTVYVALSTDNALGVIDVPSHSFTSRIAVGNAPHAVLVAGGKAYVSNEGGRPAAPGDFVNFSATTPIVADPFTGAATTGTVSVIDLASNAEVKSIAVGLHPTAMALDGPLLYVANTDDDSVSVIDIRSDSAIGTFSVRPYPGAPPGSFPDGLAVLPGHRLAVTLGRTNAVALYDVGDPSHPQRLALVPTAWYPAGVAADSAGARLVVADEQGLGAVGDADAGRAARSVGSEVGTAQILDVGPGGMPDLADVVARDNGWHAEEQPRAGVGPVALPERLGEPSLIKHVIYIIRENRTYDTILGDDPRGNGDPSLAIFGKHVTPNAHALASRFGLLDNFYTGPRRSNDGHQWATRATNPDYLQKQAGNTDRAINPLGNLTPPSSGFDALLYSKSGFLWENALRHGLTFEDYGEYTDEEAPPPAHSDIPSLEPHVIPEFSGFQLETPDQLRANIFKTHLAAHGVAGDLPALTMLTLPNDHTGGSNPLYPTPESQVADNDAGLGQIVDAVSHSAFWKDTAIFVVEDDSQSGADHVDGHRCPAFVISPYSRPGAVVSTLYSQVEMVRTIEQILGLPPMNPLDAAARPMRDAFTDVPDLEPYTALPSEISSTPNPPLAGLTGIRREWALAMTRQDLRHLDAANENLLNRDIWYSATGFRRAYPGDARVLHPREVPREQGE